MLFMFHQESNILAHDQEVLLFSNKDIIQYALFNFENFHIPSQTFQIAIVFMRHIIHLLFMRYILNLSYFQIIHLTGKVHQ